MNKLNNDIIEILLEDARTTPEKIAVILDEDKAVVVKAIQQLEKSGVIAKYSAIINEDKLDKDFVEALIEVKVSPMYSKGFDNIAEDICQFDEVKSLYLMSGAYDIAVFIEGKNLKQVARFVSEKLSVMDKVISTATHFILKKYKSEGVIFDGNESNKRMVVHP